MSKNEMTPGPWKIDLPWIYVVDEDGIANEDVACIEHMDMNGPEAQANARAIAEVPNMVEVLRELADAAQGMEHWPGGQGLHDPLDEARAILARIDGEKT